jgi:hypothetical protein
VSFTGWDSPPDRWSTGKALPVHAALLEGIAADLNEPELDASELACMLLGSEATSAQWARAVVTALVVAGLHDGRSTGRNAKLLADLRALAAVHGELDGSAPQRDAGYDATARLLAVALVTQRVIEAEARRRVGR